MVYKSLANILHVRESEKTDAQRAHHQSLEFFEEIATQLYMLLKKKETAEKQYEVSIRMTSQIDRIKEQVMYIEMLHKQIIKLQESVQEARKKMEHKQIKLTQAHVEVKKIEKMIELRKKEQYIIELKLEQKSMDDISTQQFYKQKLGG